MFGDQSIFSLQFTNICAALFFALANVCFSWARSLNETRHSISVRKLNRISFISIFTAVLFLFTSLSNFILSNTLRYIKEFDIFVFLITCAKFITLFAAMVLVILVLTELFRVGWMLFLYEYALITEDGTGMDSRDATIPKVLRRFDRDERIIECLRLNNFTSSTIKREKVFEKGNVRIEILNYNLWEKSMRISIRYEIDGNDHFHLLSTNNIFLVNEIITLRRAEHTGEPGLLNDIQFLDRL